MKDMAKFSDFISEYKTAQEPSKKEKARNWDIAIGLQQVDGLTPSRYLYQVARDNIEGKLSHDEVHQSLRQYYRTPEGDELGIEYWEADTVSNRIAELLSNSSFTFAPTTLLSIHKYLFNAALPEHWVGNVRTKDIIKVVFLEEYNVSTAEVLIPAADLSEQISLAGKEASGTSNMKLMMNGAITIGTMDGANVEICNSVGDDNIYVFGLNSWEVEELWRQGYEAREFYHNSARIRAVIDRFSRPIGGEDFSFIADYLINGGYSVADPYMCLADFDSYYNEYQRALSDYTLSPMEWSRKALVNIASSGRFSSDISIQNYANNIWRISPVRKG